MVDATRIGELLLSLRGTVATAESCTGGLVSAALTGVPGSSQWFRGGATVYSEDMKHLWARVPRWTLETFGAVSSETARALADGIRDAAGARYGLATTGFAGPGGGTAENPVGTVYLGIAWTAPGLPGAGWETRKLILPGDREAVRRAATDAALAWLLGRLEQDDSLRFR